MVGGGLIAITSYGAQNVLLSGNPDFTYFYKTFKKYSHFSQESYTCPLDGPNQLQFDQEIQLSAKLPRIGQLISDLYFVFRLPDIYCKYVDSQIRARQYDFRWVKAIGARIIRHAGIYIGGYKIHEIDADFILAKALADYDTDKFAKWQHLVGDMPELTDPARGAFSSPAGGYPLVVQDESTPLGQQLNRPSIFGRDIYVPMPFWFTQSFSQSIPQVGLEYHEVECRLTLAPIRDLYTIQDTHGYQVRPGFTVNVEASSVQDLSGTTPSFSTEEDAGAYINNFLTDIGYTVPGAQTWDLNPRLEVLYTYLTTEEARVFATQPLSFQYTQCFPVSFLNQRNQQLLKIDIQNPITRIMFLPRRSDSIEYRNDWTNLTNWWQYPAAPWVAGDNPLAPTSSGKLVNSLNGQQKDIIRHIRVLANGNEIQQVKPIEHFSRLTPWRFLLGDTRELAVYNFQLEPPSTQPSGSLNASRIRLLQIELDYQPLPVNTTYMYDVVVYLETINWFEVEGGYGGIKFNI